MSPTNEGLLKRAADLRLHGVLAHWSELNDADWLPRLIDWEEQARAQRSLDRRLSDARIGRFKALADFVWAISCSAIAITSPDWDVLQSQRLALLPASTSFQPWSKSYEVSAENAKT